MYKFSISPQIDSRGGFHSAIFIISDDDQWEPRHFEIWSGNRQYDSYEEAEEAAWEHLTTRLEYLFR